MNATDTTLQPRPYAVADLMSAEPVVVRADASLSHAAQAMDLDDISGLPVVGSGGELIGVISDTDLLHARATEWLWSNWTGLKVRHLMSSPPLTISMSASLEAATQKMERHHVHRLVVVSDDDPTLPIGVISTSDVVRALASETR
jgi:CBS domain-containing protein